MGNLQMPISRPLPSSRAALMGNLEDLSHDGLSRAGPFFGAGRLPIILSLPGRRRPASDMVAHFSPYRIDVVVPNSGRAAMHAASGTARRALVQYKRDS
jgi:hypothetical protein